MGGQVLFQDALASRLDIIKPSVFDIEKCLKDHPIALTPGVDKFISTLHEKGKIVYLVSGGFKQV
jgi:phosphoserine phosphatase